MAAHLRVNPLACTGHGHCAELLPEHVTLDEWGYPVVSPAPLSAHLVAYAEHAAASCPVLALRLVGGDGAR